MVSRREIVFAPAALVAVRALQAAGGKMSLALHQNTSSQAGFRGSLEGWAKASVKEVEITNTRFPWSCSCPGSRAAIRSQSPLKSRPRRKR